MAAAFTLITVEGHHAWVSQRDDNSYEATIVDQKIPRCFKVPLKFGTALCEARKMFTDPRHVHLVRHDGRDVLFIGRLGLLGGGGPGDDPYTCTNCGFVCPNGARYDDCIHHEHGCELAVKIREEHRQKELRRKAQHSAFGRQMFAVDDFSHQEQERKRLEEQKKQQEQKKAEEQKRLQELQRLQDEKEMEEELERYQNQIRVMI